MERGEQIQREYSWFYPVFLGIFLVISGIVIGAYLFGSKNPIIEGNFLSYITNIWTEAIGIGATILIFERWRKRQEEHQGKIDKSFRENSERHLLQSDKTTRLRLALNWREKSILIAEMSILDLLRGGDLRGIELENLQLHNTDFTGARLNQAKMSKTQFVGSNFKNADLSVSELQNTDLALTNFNNADLYRANLQEAKLYETDFTNANLQYAILNGIEAHKSIFANADLSNAKMQSAHLHSANFTNASLLHADLKHSWWFDVQSDGREFDEKRSAILPDGTKYKVQLGLQQLERFTNPEHPNFWQPDWTKESGNKIV